MLDALLLTRGPGSPITLGLVTGLFIYPNGSPVTGSAQFKLSADFACATACYGPTVVSFPVTAGTLSCSVIFNDVLSPTGSTYQITVKDTGFGQVWGGNYRLVSGTANLNLLAPG
jgi:hypothetical protein